MQWFFEGKPTMSRSQKRQALDRPRLPHVLALVSRGCLHRPLTSSSRLFVSHCVSPPPHTRSCVPTAHAGYKVLDVHSFRQTQISDRDFARDCKRSP